MPRTPSTTVLPQNVWAVEALGWVTARRSGKVAIGTELPKPHSVDLSSDGVLTWQWCSQEPPTKGWQSRRGLPDDEDPWEPAVIRGPGGQRVVPRLFEHFAKLAEAGRKEVLDFTTKWGPLQYPRSDSPCCSIATATGYTETLEQWAMFASLARALLRCATALGQGRPGLAEDWRAICSWLQNPLDPDLTKPTAGRTEEELALLNHYSRALLTQALNKWYTLSRGLVLLALETNKLLIRPSADTLFGIIGVQLAYQITRAREMAVCHHCTTFFTVARKPPTGIRRFCPACRKAKKPAMYAMRDLRGRK